MIIRFFTPMIAGLVVAAPLIAQAEIKTTKSTQDSHIQSVDYSWDVIKVVAAEGVATTIELPKDEVITTFSMGDRDAWKAKSSGNLLLVKPQAVRGNTNLIIYGQKRNYLFRLVMLKSETREVAWWVKVRSPEEIQSSPEAVSLAKHKQELKQIKNDFAASKNQGTINKEYWIVGPSELQPVAAEDNGTMTRLTFGSDNALPAAFVIEPDGSESLVDFHMEGQTMVLHRVVEKIILRRGQMVAGITNRNRERSAQVSPTGTVSDYVQRVLPMEGEQ